MENIEIFENMIKKILKTEDFSIICDLANCVDDEQLEKLTELVIDTQNLDYYLKYISLVPQANIDKIIDAILEDDDENAISSLYMAFNDEKRDRIIKKVVQAKKSSYIIKIAYDLQKNNLITDSEIKKLTNAIIKIGNVLHINQFPMYIKNVDRNKISQAIDNIISCNFMKKNKNENINENASKKDDENAN